MLVTMLIIATQLLASSSFPSSSNPLRRTLLRTALLSTAASTAASIPSTTCTTNPFLQQSTTPRFASLSPSHLPSAVATGISSLETSFKSIESRASASTLSPREILPELERARSSLEYIWGAAGHLNGVKNSDELRVAYQESQPDVVAAFQKMGQSKAIYDALSSIDLDSLPPAERRSVEGSLKSMRLGGVGLEDPTRFNEIKSRLAELSTTFSNNVLDSTKAFSLTVTDSSDMEGVPATAKAMWATEGGATEGGNNANNEDGPWKITLDAPSYLACMQHVPSRSVREAVWRGFNTRASVAPHDNLPVIQETLELREEMCGILGFADYAELSLSRKMAGSVEEVEEMSESLRERAEVMAFEELAEITALSGQEKLDPWDVGFWSERLKEKKFSLTDEELRPYFSLDAALSGLFNVCDRLFGVTITQGTSEEAETWNPDVKYYNVHDSDTKEHIASFFLDPYSRPEDKRGGAWMDVCLGKSSAVPNRDVPVAYLTCNSSPPAPAGDKPALMTFREVETLFHEAGHGLQHMLTEERNGDVAGINGVEWDAVELPSQFMENWCYDRATLFGMAKHYETGEVLPEEYYEKLVGMKTFGSGMMCMRQLYFGQTDLALHQFPPSDGGDVFATQRRIAAKYSPHLPPLSDDRFLCSFAHIFAGGYAAGYYSYKWAEVMSADAFGAFEEGGLEDEKEVRRLGRLFRETVLGLGGGVEPAEVFKRFRGRKMSSEALMRHTGLM